MNILLLKFDAFVSIFFIFCQYSLLTHAAIPLVKHTGQARLRRSGTCHQNKSNVKEKNKVQPPQIA